MGLSISETNRAFIIRWLNAIMIVCGLTTLAGLAMVIGWPLSENIHSTIRAVTSAVLTVFVGQEIIRVAIQRRPLAYIRNRWFEVLLAALAGAERLFGNNLLTWLDRTAPTDSASRMAILYLAATQITLITAIGLRTLRGSRLFSNRRLSPGLVFILSFAVLIGLGTLLLKTPHATPVQGISWIDSFFTSTSAVCVTGLNVVDTETGFTHHGKWIILGLIQVGGLGVMTLTYFFTHFIAGGVTLRDRIALQDMLSEENLDQIGTVLVVVVGFTFTFELLGAFALYASLAHSAQPVDNPAFFSLFHSISAFCNAGFSTLSAGLADDRLKSNQPFLSVIMLLIVIGGIGFPVLKNVWQASWQNLAFRIGLRRARPARVTTHSRIVVVTTVALLLGGAILIYLTEYIFAAQPAYAPEFFTALFHSVTARTAGFNIVPTGDLVPATMTIIIFLMYVGGSPASTAGGIKTSTLAIAVLSLRRVIQGRGTIAVFGREIPLDLANRALAIILLSIGWITIATLMLAALHPEIPLAELGFEVVSALSTVGLSRGITPLLGTGAKLVLIATMFVGRIGVLVFITSFVPRRPRPSYRLPETTVVIS